MAIQIFQNTGGIVQTNAFVLADDETRQAVLFDAPDHTAAPLLDEIAKRGYSLTGLWLTHGHFDHVGDHQVVTDRFPGTPILMHALDENKLQNPRSGLFQLPFTIPARSADAHVVDNQPLKLGAIPVWVLHTPGHSPGHVMYYLPSEHLLVGGDLIIGGSVGRTDLPDSNRSELEASIRRVMKLPLETRLLPGHGDPSTLDEELASNPYVRLAIEQGNDS